MLSNRLILFHSMTFRAPQDFACVLLRMDHPRYPKPMRYQYVPLANEAD